MSGATGRFAEVLRARGGVGVDGRDSEVASGNPTSLRMFAVWPEQRVYRASFIMNLCLR